MADAQDPLPNLLPPEGIVAARVRDVLAHVEKHALTVVGGATGGAVPLLAAELASSLPLVVVCADSDSAKRFADDVAFFLGDAQSVLQLPAPESSPYADLSPDRRAAMTRLGTLARLVAPHAAPFKVLCVPASALVRKFVPRTAILSHTVRVTAEDELDRDALIVTLTESGYLRVPLVEDPGTFAVRGSLLDLWPVERASPVRIELYGDLVLSIKEFDGTLQRTTSSGKGADGTEVAQTIPFVDVPPAREQILGKENVARAKRNITDLTDALDTPTTKARALLEDVLGGRPFFGADGYLPAYYDKLDSLYAFLPSRTRFLLEDPDAIVKGIREELERTLREDVAAEGTPHFPASAFFVSEDDAASSLARHAIVATTRTVVAGESEGLATFATSKTPLDLAALDAEELTRAVKRARQTGGKTSALLPLVRRITHYREHGIRTLLVARATVQAERMLTLLRHQGLNARLAHDDKLEHRSLEWLKALPMTDADTLILVGSLSRGTVLTPEGLALVTEEEIFGGRAHRARAKRSGDQTRPFLEDLRSLQVGDFVVHVEHGIGRYQGLVHREIGGTKVDLITVEYAGGDKLYLPVHRLNQIQKYSGGEHAEPKTDRLGGQSFAKTKARVQKAVREMADELLRLYADREAAVAEAALPVSDDYRAFEATFPFDETDDQAKAIEDTGRDLEKTRPMDRLVCGDVGFGKTEVAIRAAFRMALSGRQVCLLCPTTVLAQQHFRTFEARMRDYPVKLRVMSRFQSKKEQDETLKELKDGSCDIVIGTHRMLSKDVHFKNLGLLIVDEEQRFGVVHKERMKQLKTEVHVLTLSATPIPRTLQMAVSGLRDLSLITTPPSDRRAVRTIVTRYDERVLREAVERELSRGGQVFYVYNRVEGLYEKAQRLQELVPNARIAVGHGQMSGPGAQGESALERTMLDFVDGRYDVLVATAIVESGLDIPRANTIILDRADMFGLAQLYQLRGRVGRAKERAYCYLVVPPLDALSDEARARIEALERHTELGSGFKIASLDLELRGAGDLLGREQSGNLASVGFDLFVQMLEDAVREARGESVVHEVDTELTFDVEALLPDDYISDVGVRLSLYKRLAGAIDEAAVSECASELEDRFGPPPLAVKNLVALMHLKTELRRLRVLGCEASGTKVTLHLREDTPLDPKKIMDLVKGARSPYRLTPDMRLSRRFDPPEANGLTSCDKLLVELGKCLKP